MDISVIVPLYKGMRYIDKILNMLSKNIERLNYSRDIEVIFINDFPQEEFPLYHNVERTMSVQFICNENNLGIHRSRLEGLEVAKGIYVLFLDQDDQINDTYLKTQLECIGDADAVLCNGWYREGKRIYSDMQNQNRAITKQIYLSEQNLIISPGQVLIRKESIPEEWRKNILLQNGSDDVLLWTLMFQNHLRFAINVSCQYIHNENGENTSLDFCNMTKSIKELLSVVQKAHFLDSTDEKKFADGVIKRLSKYRSYIKILDHWDDIVNAIEMIYQKRQYKSIAIYGFGVIGKKLICALEGKNIKITYIVDENASSFEMPEYSVYSLQKIPEAVDCIIITSVFVKEEIKRNLKRNKYIGEIVSLDEV